LFDGIWSIFEALATTLPDVLKLEIERGNEQLVNIAVKIMMHFDTNLRCLVSMAMWTFGVDSPFKAYQKLRDYPIKDVAKDIKCPTLVLEAKNDHFLDRSI
jgi:hypothetical protein